MCIRLLTTCVAILLAISACADSDEGILDLRNDSAATASPDDTTLVNPSGELPAATRPGVIRGETDVDTTSNDTIGGVADNRWSRTAQSRSSATREVAQVSEVRTSEHAGYDRLVLAFNNDQIPGYDVRYLEEPPIECGSGRTVDIAGPEVLQIRLEPARGYTEKGSSTVAQRKGDVGSTALRAFAVACDFEAVFTIIAGVRGGAAYRILELRDPARIAVDVRHTEP